MYSKTLKQAVPAHLSAYQPLLHFSPDEIGHQRRPCRGVTTPRIVLVMKDLSNLVKSALLSLGSSSLPAALDLKVASRYIDGITIQSHNHRYIKYRLTTKTGEE